MVTRVALVAIVLAATACVKRPSFSCASDSECGTGGVCEPTHFCAFASPSCSSGFAYGDLSGPFANQCVGAMADVPIADSDLSCTCATDHLACGGGDVACPLGCMNLTTGGARCLQIVPSNNVDPALAMNVSMPLSVGGTATFDTDTGAITGAVTRAMGQGVVDGIGYYQPSSTLGVFVVHSLDVTSGGTIRFTGSHPVVILVGTDATIAGTIDGRGGCYGTDLTCAGPGGGAGATLAAAAGGCGPGGAGGTDTSGTLYDGGGGGGGGGLAGGAGGTAGAMAAGGSSGIACMPATLEPLVGGSGGGPGGPGTATTSNGGGGGGALQLTALGTITVGGAINMGGAGGPGAVATAANAGAGGGGGAGGGILVEAITVTVTGVLAANGGGGGSGGHSPSGGNDGTTGLTSAAVAPGGASVSGNGAGGTGGARSGMAQPGQSLAGNSGGGGGAVGVIHVRAYSTPTLNSMVSPQATTATITVN